MQYIMIDEQIAFCLLIMTQKPDDDQRLGHAKQWPKFLRDSRPEG